VKVVPSIINAVVCTSAISSGSACIFIASRTLYGLSCDGHAPRIFQQCNRFGTPYYAIGLTCLLLPLVYLNVANDTSVVFGWFVNITTISGLIGWVVIEATYLRFYTGLRKQGFSRDCKLYLRSCPLSLGNFSQRDFQCYLTKVHCSLIFRGRLCLW
jgi:amino acid transporter